MYGEEEMRSFPMQAARVAVGALLRRVRERFGDRLRVDLIDPRCSFFLFDLIRFNVRATEATWVLDGRLLFRGVPEEAALLSELERRLPPETAGRA
jgi:hypothetical protein